MTTHQYSQTSMDDSPMREVLSGFEDIHLAVLFGSVAKETARADSDLDIAVLANHKLSPNEKIQLIEAFAQKIGRPVDLIDLFDPPQPLLGQIIKTGRRILGTDDAFANLAYRNIVDQADFMPLRTRALLERREAWISKS
jgi:predicted nucleotidyltransferase